MTVTTITFPTIAYTTIAPTRAPLDLVKQFASTPRYGSEDRGFDPSDQYWFFSESVAFVILVLCFSLLCFYKLYHYARGCCWKCQRNVEAGAPNPGMCCAGQVDAGQAQRSILFAWLLGAVLAFGALTIVAQGRLDRTTASVEDGAKDLADLFENIDGLSDDLLVYANGASAAAARLTCVDGEFEDKVNEYAARFLEEADEVKETTDGAGDEVDDAKKLVEGRQVWVDRFLLILVGLVALVLPSALYGCVLASPWCLEKVTARYAFFVCVVLSVLLAVEFGALVKASDFCEAPDKHFLDLVDHRLNLDAEDQALVEYYVTCGGVNPLFEPLNATVADVEDLQTAVDAAIEYDLCEPSGALDALAAACDGALETVSAFQVAASCEAVNPTYQDLVHVSLCRHFTTGLRRPARKGGRRRAPREGEAGRASRNDAPDANAAPRRAPREGGADGIRYYLAVAHAVATGALFLALFLIDYVVETLQLSEELEDLKCEVLTSPRPAAGRAHARAPPRTLETELTNSGRRAPRALSSAELEDAEREARAARRAPRTRV